MVRSSHIKSLESFPSSYRPTDFAEEPKFLIADEFEAVLPGWALVKKKNGRWDMLGNDGFCFNMKSKEITLDEKKRIQFLESQNTSPNQDEHQDQILSLPAPKKSTLRETVKKKKRKKASTKKTGNKGRGRPLKGADRSIPIFIRLNPLIIKHAKKLAEKRKIGYQTVINEELLKSFKG